MKNGYKTISVKDKHIYDKIESSQKCVMISDVVYQGEEYKPMYFDVEVVGSDYVLTNSILKLTIDSDNIVTIAKNSGGGGSIYVGTTGAFLYEEEFIHNLDMQLEGDKTYMFIISIYSEEISVYAKTTLLGTFIDGVLYCALPMYASELLNPEDPVLCTLAVTIGTNTTEVSVFGVPVNEELNVHMKVDVYSI